MQDDGHRGGDPRTAYDEHVAGRADGATTTGGLGGPPESWLVSFLLLHMPEGGARVHELEKRMDRVGFGRIRPGFVYRTLGRMEDEGLVASGREDGDPRPSRREYEITDSGRAYLDFWAESLERYREEMNTFLRAYEERRLDGGRK